jgi:hypothetical protein
MKINHTYLTDLIRQLHDEDVDEGLLKGQEICMELQDFDLSHAYFSYRIMVYISKLFWITSELFSNVQCSNANLALVVLAKGFLVHFQSSLANFEAALFSGYTISCS